DLPLSMPESREFYWSKIAREIQKLEPERNSLAAFDWRRLLWPISLTAGAIAVCFLVVVSQNSPADKFGTAIVASSDLDTPIVEPTQADSEAITYQDEADGTTLVWFSADDNSVPAKAPTATF
ncbi:MAG TPA: hypothetical protein VN516_08555, partial [Candidatus Baltobacteraceae bacterium]|nr:hypothetical protein [Candidatus Baltobacteraceae bacterium]